MGHAQMKMPWSVGHIVNKAHFNIFYSTYSRQHTLEAKQTHSYTLMTNPDRSPCPRMLCCVLVCLVCARVAHY